MAHKVFEKPIRVHFSNCDPAGIVFHPQYFVLINELMEDFLEDVAGVGFIGIRRYGVGFPVVSVKTQFTKPSRPSDRLMGQVWVEKIGDKSIRFAFVLKDEAEERLRCVETSVCVKLTARTSAENSAMQPPFDCFTNLFLPKAKHSSTSPSTAFDLKDLPRSSPRRSSLLQDQQK